MASRMLKSPMADLFHLRFLEFHLSRDVNGAVTKTKTLTESS